MLWSRRKSSNGPKWCSGRISSRSDLIRRSPVRSLYALPIKSEVESVAGPSSADRGFLPPDRDPDRRPSGGDGGHGVRQRGPALRLQLRNHRFGRSVALAVPLGDLPRRDRRAQGARPPRHRRVDIAPAGPRQENLPRARPSADALCHLAGVLRRPGAGAHQPPRGGAGDRGFDGLSLRHGRGVRGVRCGAAAARSVARSERTALGGRDGDGQGNRGEGMTIAVFLGSLLGAMALGVPIAYALLVSGVALMWYLNLFDAQILAQNLIEGANSFTLLAVPFFL